jgi:hypothetical protein
MVWVCLLACTCLGRTNGRTVITPLLQRRRGKIEKRIEDVRMYVGRTPGFLTGCGVGRGPCEARLLGFFFLNLLNLQQLVR